MDYNNGRSYDYGNGDYPYRGNPSEYGYSNKFHSFFSNSENRELLKVSAVFGFALILHILLQNVYSIVLSVDPAVYKLYTDNTIFSLTAEMLYSLICVGIPFLLSFCILQRKKISSVSIPFNCTNSKQKIFLLIVGGIGLCMAGNVLTSLIATYAENIGVGFYSYDYISQTSDTAPESVSIFIITLIHTAILPAFIEEISIRGCLMQPLRKYGDLFAVISSAFIFGILHGNLTQAPFAFIAGCILGLICIYTDSMWPNIIIHMFNNAISVFQTVATANTDTKSSYIVSAVIIYGLIVIGILALYGYFSSGNISRQLYKPSPGHYKNKIRLFFLCPATLLALIYFAIELYSDIYTK